MGQGAKSLVRPAGARTPRVPAGRTSGSAIPAEGSGALPSLARGTPRMIDRTGDVPNVPLAPVRARGGVPA